MQPSYKEEEAGWRAKSRSARSGRTRSPSLFEIASRLRELLKLVEGQKSSLQYEARFAAQTGRRITIVPVEDIDWIEANGDYVALHVGDRTQLLLETMSRVEARLDPTRFIRVHRSMIVQASRICELETRANGEYLLRLTSGAELRCSRGFSDRIRRWL
jgi:two-component system, LytTR family, response regulator